MTRHLFIALLVPFALWSCDQNSPVDPPKERVQPAATEQQAASGETRPRTVYVPAYSQVPVGKDMERRSLLSILLSVRNVDSTTPVTLTQVEYFDTSGHLVRRYLEAPRTLQPLETAEFTVLTHDKVGGSGANFLVYWSGPSDAHALLTEAVMMGHVGASYISFTSRGVELDRRPDPEEFDSQDLRPIGAPEPPVDAATD